MRKSKPAPREARPERAPHARSGTIPFLLLMILAAVGLYLGWRLFWFLTDDAFIEFRYCSNSRLGYGYVWNAPPFLPVEGYTSFLWVALLDVVWRVTGVEPPRTANLISLVLAYAQLVLASLMLVRIRWKPFLRGYRFAFLALFLTGVLLNRTFLSWTSSGLETALFNFLITAWLFVILVVSEVRRRIVLASTTAALLALTRPDGLVFVAATCAVLLVLVRPETDRKPAWRWLLLGLLPFVAVVVHEAWRVRFYGAWLPNTYYAKVVAPWPASGIRYLASFIMEYFWWFPALAAIVLAVIRRSQPGAKSSPRKPLTAHAIPAIVIGAVLFQLGYYTFIVGGDHFEFRIYSYTIPLAYIAFAYALNALAHRARVALALMAGCVLLSMPLPWTHWKHSQAFTTRKQTLHLMVRVAPLWPKPVAWYADLFDRCQWWLIQRSVCKRHQEHKVFWIFQTEIHPSREEGSKISRDGFPVHAVPSVGMPSWVFPNVNIIDIIGLNDFIVARTPYPNQQRKMAHGRRGPDEYVESYSPNVKADGTVTPRAHPLTRERIACLEAYWRSRLPEIEAGFKKFEDWRLCPE